MNRIRYLFVSYQLALVHSNHTITGDYCFAFDEDHKVTIEHIRDKIIDMVSSTGRDTRDAVPAIIGLQILDEDVARMLYGLDS